jgi:hypothetical protein
VEANPARGIDITCFPLLSCVFLLLVHIVYLPWINPLNAELNPICYLLRVILLGNLKFMGTCIVSIFQYIFKEMQCYTVYLYLETALYVSGGNSTHHQERIRHPQHTQTGSNSSTIAADSSNGVTSTRCCRYSCMRS